MIHVLDIKNVNFDLEFKLNTLYSKSTGIKRIRSKESKFALLMIGNN